MRSIAVLVLVLVIVGVGISGSYASSSADVKKHTYGTWCLNTEEFMGDVTVEGSIFTFRKDGTYTYKHGGKSTDKFTLEGDTLHLENFGDIKILKITAKEMTAKAYSNYHFTKDECLPLVEQAVKTTKLNNAIIMNDMKTIKKLAKEGVDVSKKDTRSGLQSTPLMVAIEHSNIKMVKYIMSLKPDLKVKNAMGETAMDVAKKDKNTEAIELLKKQQ